MHFLKNVDYLLAFCKIAIYLESNVKNCVQYTKITEKPRISFNFYEYVKLSVFTAFNKISHMILPKLRRACDS